MNAIRNSAQEDIELATILSAEERMRVDAAGTGVYHTQHCDRANEVLHSVRVRRANAILVSVGYCESGHWEGFSRMIREVPRIPTIALLSRETGATAGTLLRLGREGVRSVIDVRRPEGWKELRRLVSDQCIDMVEQIGLTRLGHYAGGMTDECWHFFETVLRLSRHVSSIRVLADQLRILPSTLMSRFFRAGLPAPKRYLAMIRLTRAAYLFENHGFSIANVANHLEYSSPQSFGRHVKTTMGMTALSFRQRYGGQDMFDLFEQQLLQPYVNILHDFRPLAVGRLWGDGDDRKTRPT